jgi:hypothetical protein
MAKSDRPMGRQINYYMTSEDHAAFEERLRRAGDFVAIRSRSNKPGPQAVDLSSALNTIFLYLVRSHDLPAVIAEEIPARGEFSVSGLYSPVVEYMRCYQGDGFIRPGRLYFREGYFDQDGRWVTKNDAFIAWARRLLRQARSFLAGRRSSFYYVGERADAARSAGVQLLQPWEGP